VNVRIPFSHIGGGGGIRLGELRLLPRDRLLLRDTLRETLLLETLLTDEYDDEARTVCGESGSPPKALPPVHIRDASSSS
tara:strand:+ start:1502 stop:1741 length:240 start_codon:yes stop_codon:yes gene_type:complete